MNEPNNKQSDKDRLQEQERMAKRAETSVSKEAREGRVSGDLQNDVNAALGISEEPLEKKENKTADIAEKLSIERDTIYPGAVATPRSADTSISPEDKGGHTQKPSTLLQTAHSTPPSTEPTGTAQKDPSNQNDPTVPESVGKRVAIRTLQGDIADSVKTQSTSLASIAIAETKRRGADPSQKAGAKQKTSRLRVFFVVLGVLLMLGGIGALGAVLLLEGDGAVDNNDVESPLIFVNEHFTLAIPETRFGALDALEDLRGTQGGMLSLGHIAKVNLSSLGTTTPLSLDEFITRLSTDIPGSLMRTFTGRYLLGIHSLQQSEYALLIEVKNRENAFAGMLRWEEDLADDMPFLARETTQATRTAADTAGTGTPAVSSDIFTDRTTFYDRVIENRDVRVLLDANGDIRLGYALPRSNILVIATNENSFIEIFDRLSGVRFSE